MKLSKKLGKKILGDVEDGCNFFCSNGKVFSNLGDLKKDLKKMNDESFFHHTGHGRNDFSNWIGECLGDVDLANELVGLDKKGSLKKIESRMKYIKNYLEGKA
ncbi:MAG: DUF5752 family protein [Nanoarchaeota archaeon]|nr:DUF5752 family protein [Nanoarchaeota archaeon]